MRYAWLFLIGIPLLVILTYIGVNDKKVVLEKFGMFGDSAIPYGEFVKSTHTEKELPEFRKEWAKKDPKIKSGDIDWWNKLPITQQKKMIAEYTKLKEERQKIDDI